MKFYDLTVPLSPNTANWPGGIKYAREEVKTSAITSNITMRSHYATHVDAPKHFLFNKQSVDKIPAGSFIGKYRVLEIKNPKIIERRDIEKLKIAGGDRVLFKTRNSGFVTKKEFNPNYVSLGLDAAQYLAEKKIALVGIDYFGIEAKGSPGHLVHKTLLKNNIVIAEGLNLSKIKTGIYNGAILPLLVADGDGAPARAILWK
jgi:arylformamidase